MASKIVFKANLDQQKKVLQRKKKYRSRVQHSGKSNWFGVQISWLVSI